jgi:hypothetical protein
MTMEESETKVRCKRCGFLCDTGRDKTGSGSGVTYVSITHTATTCPDDPMVIAGCPFCGTKNYLNWQR